MQESFKSPLVDSAKRLGVALTEQQVSLLLRYLELLNK